MFFFNITDAMIVGFVAIISTLFFHIFFINFLKIYGEKKLPIFLSVFVSLIFSTLISLKLTNDKIDDYLSSLFLYLAFIICYVEFFFLINRAFSLNILNEVFKNKNVKKSSLILTYGDGRGLEWMFEKRIKNLENLNFIEIKKNKIILKDKKLILVKLLYFFTKFFNIQKSGL